MRIELRRVSKHFGRVAALDDLSLDLASGSRIALIGPNGSGKSTLTRVLMGMQSCEGDVRLDGLSPQKERARLAHRLAYVPQVGPQLGASVGEVVRTVCDLRGLEADAVAATARRLELDLGEVASKSVRELSGGMRQKLLIALAFSAPASLVILDEPTSSLDAQTRQVFFELVEERVRDATLILCSHRLEEVRHLVDHVVELKSGRLAYGGAVTEYLRGRARGVVEVQMSGEAEDDWLRAHGFRRGASGAWARVVAQGEKVTLLRGMLTGLDGHIENILVRDFDQLAERDAEERKPMIPSAPPEGKGGDS